MKRRRSATVRQPIVGLTPFGRQQLFLPMFGGMVLLALCLSISAAAYLKSEGPIDSKGNVDRDKRIEVPVPVIKLKGGVQSNSEDEMFDQTTTQIRVASNILLRSGYLTNFVLTPEPGTPNLDATVRVREEALICANDGGPEGERDRGLTHVVLALVAIEKFNRTPIQRQAERLYALSYLTVTGRLPDISLGPAQVKPSTLTKLSKGTNAPTFLRTTAALEGEMMLNRLMDECSALAIAAGVVTQLKAELNSSSYGDAAIVRAYGGQRRRTHAAIDYVPVVERIETILSNDDL